MSSESQRYTKYFKNMIYKTYLIVEERWSYEEIIKTVQEIEEPKISDGKKKIASKIDNGKRKKVTEIHRIRKSVRFGSGQHILTTE